MELRFAQFDSRVDTTFGGAFPFRVKVEDEVAVFLRGPEIVALLLRVVFADEDAIFDPPELIRIFGLKVGTKVIPL